MWNGATWAPMALGFTQVDALAVFDDGSGPALYAAASLSIGPVTLDGVARWTGSSWSPVGGVVNGTVLELAAYDDGTGPALYAGGTFTSVGGVGASNVARWSGTQWSALGAGTDGIVRSLRAFDDGLGSALYVGGSFNVAGGVWSQGLARWKSNGWTAVGGGVGGGLSSVNALAVLPGDGGPCSWRRIVHDGDSRRRSPGHGGRERPDVEWDDARHARRRDERPGHRSPGVDDGSGPALYASGSFKTAGGAPVRSLARRVPGGFAPLGPGFDAEPLALAAYDDGSGAALHAAGAFSTAGGGREVHRALEERRLAAALARADRSVQPFVHALRVFDDGSGPALYAGGQFGFAGTAAASNVAKWNGVAWYPLGAGLSGPVEALEVFDDGSGPALYAGGSFPGAVARWNGAAWATVGGGLSGGVALTQVFALKSVDLGFGPRLAAGGDFSVSASSPCGPVNRANIANWWTFKRGADWRHPQGPSSSVVDADRHPVVHVAFADAEAFAAWEGKALPSEAEWELAARGGLDEKAYAWGDEFLPATSTWPTPGRGSFPGRTCRATATRAPRRSMRSRPTATACWT